MWTRVGSWTSGVGLRLLADAGSWSGLSGHGWLGGQKLLARTLRHEVSVDADASFYYGGERVDRIGCLNVEAWQADERSIVAQTDWETIMDAAIRLAAERGLDLHQEPEGLVLAGQGMCLRSGFQGMRGRISRGSVQRELLVKAARMKGLAGEPVVVDATAGLGEDSLLLAAAGFRVLMFERDPVIGALLADSVRLGKDDEGLSEVVGRMSLRLEDSVSGLRGLDFRPDVVLLDPMFPERTKSASVKKKFQLLHCLERPCEDETELLQAALAACPRKIVVKRPAKGPYLAGVKPDYSLSGKAIRYDVVVPQSRGDL